MSDKENTKSIAAYFPAESTLLGDYRDSFHIGDKLKISVDQTIWIVVSVSENETVIKRYSDYKSKQKKATDSMPYYNKFCGKYGA